MKTDKILVVLPHPDDEVFPMSGTLSKYIGAGSEVTYACMTLGQMGRNLGNPPFANRVTLPNVRKKELQASCDVLGIKDLRMMGLHDKTIEFEPHDFIDGLIMEIIEDVQPDVIFTFYPGYGVHPDHNACGEAVIRTVGRMKQEKRPVVLCTAFPTDNDLGQPDVINDVTAFLEKKMGALRAHSSQFKMFERESQNPKTRDAFIGRVGTERFWIYPFE